MAGIDSEWKTFFERVKNRPAAFYTKCAARLEAQDIFEPGDLADIDEEIYVQQLTCGDVPATAGEISFLRQAIELSRKDAGRVTDTSASGRSISNAPATESSEADLEARIEAAVTAEHAKTEAATQECIALKKTVAELERALQAAQESSAETVEESSAASIDSSAPVATVILQGTEDPTALLKRGGLELEWKSCGTTKKVKKFREQAIKHIVSADLTLPTLYLHFLDSRFRPQTSGRFDNALRAGNDNAEIQIVLPAMYMDATRFRLSGDLGRNFKIALGFVKSHGEAEISATDAKAGGFSPKQDYTGSVDPQRLYYSLMTARPKAPINLDKSLFGMPSNADLYLFAQNHASVEHMNKAENDAFQACIAELPDEDNDDLRKLAGFLKIFYEGGFAYNHKEVMERGYIPKNVGVAGLGVVPAFPGQAGIGTGYPYLVESRFLRFTDSVPVTIPAIREMSHRHGRYGLCFTRAVFVWEDEAFRREGVLNFCCIVPHGGFFYTPSRLGQYHSLGGLVYAFGEAKDKLEVPVSVEEPAAAAFSPPVRRPDRRATTGSVSSASSPVDDRVCVICLTENAVMATVPCGHRAYCPSCAPAAQGNRCPVCRQQVTNIMRVY